MDDLDRIVDDLSFVDELPNSYIDNITYDLNLSNYKTDLQSVLYNTAFEIINSKTYLTQQERDEYDSSMYNCLYMYKLEQIDNNTEIVDNDDIIDDYENLLMVLDDIYSAHATKFGLQYDKISNILYSVDIENDIIQFSNTNGLENKYEYVTYLKRIISEIRSSIQQPQENMLSTIKYSITNIVSDLDECKAISTDIIVSDITNILKYLLENNILPYLDDIDLYVFNAVHDTDDYTSE
jgi:hypothetical protein